ncbi:uncharacterized protein LOC143912855 [Arctopsyche grandis]|uniref:uncharacterized protein LOC143912855 n=1 Tax=Arctopsyche grandis TaxID=121162 RepID=UPI00406D83A3
MSNGVEVIVANGDKTDGIPSDKSKHLRIVTTPDGDKTTTLAPSTVKNNVRMTIAVEDQGRNNSAQQQQQHQLTPSHPRHQSLLSSSTSTTFEPYHQYNHHHQNTELLPNPQRHNFVIKTCYTTYTYLTTTVQKMRTTVSTYETVVSTITTEPIDFATMPPAIEAQKTTQPQLQMFQTTKAAQNVPILQPKIEKRVDEAQSNHDLIQPSEVTHPTSCSLTSCPCTVTLTESLKEKLKTKLPEDLNDDAPLQLKRSPFKPTKYSSTIVDTSPTAIGDYKKDKINKHNNKQGSPPPEKVVQKYTEVMSDQSSDSNKKGDKNKHSNSKPIVVEQSNKRNVTKNVEDKRKPANAPEKIKEPQKVQKNKFEVADLLKLGTLGIKKLAPMIEQMTGSFIRRQEQTKPSTTTVRPVSKITPYVVNKRVDDFRIPNKPNSNSQFPIYIPVDEKDIDTSESQNIFYNSTLQQSLAWHNVKNSRNNLAFGKPIHESPLLNGGIPISPGEIITTNSDVIVGKPVVGGPNIGHINKPDLKQNNGPPPNFHADSHSQSSNFQDVRTKPPQRGQGIKQIPFIRDDDTYDLRPPMMLMPRPPVDNKNQFNQNNNVRPDLPPKQDNQHFHQNNNARPDLPKPDSQHFIQRPQENKQHFAQHSSDNQHFAQHSSDNQHFNQHSHDNTQHFNQQHPPNNQHFNQHLQDNKQQLNQHPPNNQHFNQHPPNNQHFNHHAQENKQQFNQQHSAENQQFKQLPPNKQPKPHNVLVDHVSGSIHPADTLLDNHGRPAFLDYIPALDSPGTYQNYVKNNLITRKTHDDTNQFNSLDKNKPPTPKLPQQENKFNFVNTAQNQNKIKEAPEPILLNDLVQKNTMKPFLVDIQPSRVANVIIPHGNSASALIFAGSSEPHKNGEYIDDPLPYPEPGYFGSFSIDAPHLTSVHVGGTIPIKPNPDQRPNGPINNNPDPLVVHHGVSGLIKDVKPPHGQRWKYEEPQKQPSNFPNFAKLPPPISNQESNINFGPHFVLKKPESFNTIEFSHNNNNNPPPIRNLKSTAKPPTDYAADLAVPPPPPAVHVKYESNVGVLNSNFNKFENRPHFGGAMPQSEASHKHPTFVQNNNQQQHSPPKITSEVYFASTASNGGDFGQKLKPFTVNIPLQQNFNNRPPHPHPPAPVQENTFEHNKFVNTFEGGLVTLNAGSKVNIPNPAIQIPTYNVRVPNSPVSNTHYSVPQHGGLITLNAGTSVFNPNLPEQTISGTNIPVSNNKPTFNTHNVKEFHAHEGESTGIKIGTNLAIKVEPQVIQAYNPDIQYGLGGIGSVSTAEFKPHVKGPEIIVGGNSWKAGSLTDDFAENENSNGVPDNVHIGNQKVHVVHASSFNSNNYNQNKPAPKYNISKVISNSHANFPMTRENATNYNKFENVNSNNQNFNFKPLNSGSSQVKFKYEDYQINTNKSNVQRPIVVQTINSKPQPDFNTIQYGTTENRNQFAFVSQTERPLSKIPQYPQPNLKVESTTHNIIPLSFDFESERYGDPSKNGIFGQKLHSVGLPPTNFNWQQNRPILNPKDKYAPDFKGIDQFMAPPPLTTPQYNPAYIPSNFNSNRQPVYDIPMKDHIGNRYNTTKQTTQYITSNVYNTVDKNKYQQHVAQESVKVAVISSTPHTLTNEVTVNFRPLKNASNLKDEILVSSGNDYIHYGGDKRKPGFNADDNTGSQTEEPFDENNYKEISLATLPGIRHTTQPAYNILPFSQMAPRPFTINENVKTTTKLQNGDAQRPRPFQKPDKLSLNIGEVSAKTTTRTTPIVVANITQNIISITTQKPRPQLSVKNNTLTYNNKIITSNFNVATNRPIAVMNTTIETSSLPTFTIPERSNVSSIIPNLSPPPPAVADYNFKPTNEDDTIMGMSPPPRTPAPKQPTKEYTKYADISTFRPGYNSVKNPYKRPGDYYRITSRPFTRYTTPSTPSHRHKVTSGTTVTRIVLPSRASVPSWKSPVRIETKLPVQFTKTHMTTNSIINTTPLDNVGSEIMHPDTYPEEAIGIGSVIKSDPIVPDKVNRPVIYPTMVQQSKSSTTILNYDPTLIQTSENFLNENAIRKTETLKYAPTINANEQASKSSKTLTHKFTIPTAQTISSAEREITINPVHHAGNEIIQSDDHRPSNKLESLTAITFTTTLERPVSTVMTTRFVTLTHTLTVTQTKTSVVSPVVGSTTQTQTLTLTNTQTSTIVDVVTEVHTLVQPTTIVETITKHVSATILPAWETKYPKVPIEPTRIRDHPYRVTETLDLADVSLSSNEEDLIITPDNSSNEMFMNHNDTSQEENNNTFLVVMTKSQSGGSAPSINPVMIIDNPDSGEATRIEEIGTDGVSHVLLGEILLAGNEYINKPHPINPTAYGKECQPDCKASRNERCQRMHGLMKCVCRPGFARMFPDRPCKPTYTYSLKLALSNYGNKKLIYQDAFADQNSEDFQDLAMATHEGINRMVMQSDLRDVYHGVHINGFQPVKIPVRDGKHMNGVMNDFYVQLSDNAHETRLKEVIEKYLRNNNYSLGGTNVYAAEELVDKLEVGDFNECMSNQFHDCSEHAECFNLRATYTCSCREGYADLSVNSLYPGRICSAEPVGCEKCNYHGTCYTRDDARVLCECFQWYAGEHCHINLKVILISLATLGAILFTLLLICLILTCAKKHRPNSSKHTNSSRRSQIPPNVMTSCIGNLPVMHQGGMQSSKMHSTIDRRALIQERGNDSGGEGSSVHNMSLPYIPAKKVSQISHKSNKKLSLSDEGPSRDKKPFTLMIPRAKYHPTPTTSPLMMDPGIRDSKMGGKRKTSGESNETKLLSYLDAGPGACNDHMNRRKQSNESSYSMNKAMPQKYSTGALISAGFKVSTTVMGGVDLDSCLKEIPDDGSSVAKSNTLPMMDMQSQFNSLRKAYSQEDINDWTDAERRIGELTMSEARSFDGTLVKPSTKIMRSTTGSNKSSAHYTQHEANTMAERDLGSTFLLPHVHLYKPDMGSDVSEFDSL